MNTILSHENAPYFKSILPEVEIVYFNDIFLFQPPKVGSLQVHVDENVSRKILEVKNKHYQVLNEHVNEGSKFAFIIDWFYQKLTSYIDEKFIQQKKYIDDKFLDQESVIDDLCVDFISFSSKISQSMRFSYLQSQHTSKQYRSLSNICWIPIPPIKCEQVATPSYVDNGDKFSIDLT